MFDDKCIVLKVPINLTMINSIPRDLVVDEFVQDLVNDCSNMSSYVATSKRYGKDYN